MSSFDTASISSLPDVVLQRIFSACDLPTRPLVHTLSGVCKRWQALIFDPKGDLLDNLVLPLRDPNFNAAACGAWLQRQLHTGAVHSPLHILCLDYQSVPAIHQNEDFVAILSCAGTTLNSLTVCGGAAVFPSRSFPCLWAVPNLTALTLSEWNCSIRMDLFTRGVQCLRKLERFDISSKAIEVVDGVAPPPVGIEYFPEVLCMLPSLQSLQFTNQGLNEIPDSISQLTRLTQLVIRGCVVRYRDGFLPPVLATLLHLQSLVLVVTVALPLEGGDPDFAARSKWKQMICLKDLCISQFQGNFQTTFPTEVRCSFVLCICAVLPQPINDSVCWRSDKVDSESFGSLLDKMQSLTLLDVAGIPENIGLSSLKNSLTALAFEDGAMEAFPQWMAALSSLKALEVKLFKLTNWSLPALAGLQTLSITYSNLREVSESLCKLTALTHLDLTDCDITRISPCISRLQKLCKLVLICNNLSKVPNLAGLTALEIVHLRDNKLPKRKGVRRLRAEYGNILLPKMAVTEASLSWMLQCRYIQKVYIDVTKEEKSKLGGIRQELQRALRGRNVLAMRNVGQYM